MTNPHISFKNDTYRKIRGGYSRLLDISCASYICYYQKDGPGILKRMYLDRINGLAFERLRSKFLKELPQLICPNCKQHIGIPINYEKENRLAYRLFVGAVLKKIIRSHSYTFLYKLSTRSPAPERTAASNFTSPFRGLCSK